MIHRIPGEETRSASLLQGGKSKKGNDSFEKTSSVKGISSNIQSKDPDLWKQGKLPTIISIIKHIQNTDKDYYQNYFPSPPQYLMLPKVNNYDDNGIIRSSNIISNSNYNNFPGQKKDLGFNLQTLSRLSWSDIGDYFSNLINEVGLGLNVRDIINSSSISNNSSINDISGNISPLYFEPSLANQFVYDYMIHRIPGEETRSASLLQGGKSKKGNDSFEKTSSVKGISSNIQSKDPDLWKQGKLPTIISIIKHIQNTDKDYNNFPGQKKDLGFNLQTLSRLSWSDIGDYFSNLINEVGLGLNVRDIINSSSISNNSSINDISGNISPLYFEPSLANQFVYDYMIHRIPGEETRSASLLQGGKSKKGNDSFEKTSSVKGISSNIQSKDPDLWKQGKLPTIISIIKHIQNTDKDYNNFPGQKKDLGFNLQTLSRLSWSDIGDYFSNLINEVGLGLNVRDIINSSSISNNSSINDISGNISPLYFEPSLANQFVYGTKSKIPVEKEDDRIREAKITKRYLMDIYDTYRYNIYRHNTNIASPQINIITDNSFSEIADRYNADAVTLGPNVIFAKNKFDSHSPRGIALLVHELTHIYQLKKLQDFPQGNYHDSVARFKDEWEQEALLNEQFTYDLLTFPTTLYQNALPYSDIQAMSYNNIVSSIAPPYYLANSL